MKRRLSRGVCFTLLGLVPVAAQAAPGRPEDVLGILGLVVLLLLAIPSLATAELLIMALLPAPVAAAREALEHRRLRCFAAGAAVMVLGMVLVAALSQLKGLGEFLAVLVLAALALGIVLGLPAMGALVGAAVLQLSGRTPSPLAATAWGLVLILLASLFPVLGWALCLFLCLASLGAVVLSLAGGRRAGRVQETDLEPLERGGEDP